MERNFSSVKNDGNIGVEVSKDMASASYFEYADLKDLDLIEKFVRIVSAITD